MMERWQQLLPRERLAVLLAVLAVLSLMLYQLAWRPLSQDLQRERELRERQEQDYLWMNEASQKIRAYRGGGATAPAQVATRSLLVEADDSLKRSGMAQSLQEIKPDGNSLLRVVLKDVPFDRAVAWLGYLAKQGISVSSVVFNRVGDTPNADVRLTLERSAGDTAAR